MKYDDEDGDEDDNCVDDDDWDADDDGNDNDFYDYYEEKDDNGDDKKMRPEDKGTLCSPVCRGMSKNVNKWPLLVYLFIIIKSNY